MSALPGTRTSRCEAQQYFLAERGNVYDIAKLLDFGLVRPAQFGSDPICCVSGELQGSPQFMCPEQSRGQKPDCRGDIYSLAVVGFYLLSGRVPFEDDNPVMLVVACDASAANSGRLWSCGTVGPVKHYYKVLEQACRREVSNAS